MLLDGGQQDGFPHSVLLGAGKGRSHLVYKVLQTRASKSQISQSLRLSSDYRSNPTGLWGGAG